MTLLRTKFGEASGTHYLIGQEHHQDGNFHLHVFIECLSDITSRNPLFCDIVWVDPDKLYHPNIQAARDKAQVIKYCTKEDPEPTIWPLDWDYKTLLVEKRKGQWALATPLLLAGKSERELLAEMPAFVLANLSKVREAVTFLRISSIQASIPTLQEFLTWELPLDFDGLHVRDFPEVWRLLRDNLANMAFGRRQLYLHGPTGIGKSTFLQHLMLSVRTYLIPTEDFYDMYEDHLYDLSALEEFKGQKSIQWLNQWLDGGISNVRKKGSQYLKSKATPTLILSNFDIWSSDVYPNMQESTSIGTLRRRLASFEATAPLMHAMTRALRLFLGAHKCSLPSLSESPISMENGRSVPPLPVQPARGKSLEDVQTIQKENPLWRRQTASPLVHPPPVTSVISKEYGVPTAAHASGVLAPTAASSARKPSRAVTVLRALTTDRAVSVSGTTAYDAFLRKKCPVTPVTEMDTSQASVLLEDSPVTMATLDQTLLPESPQPDDL